jgi:hypothetical protein
MALYGFHDLEDIFGQRVVGDNVQIVDGAITRAVEEHNRQLTALLGLFAERTTEYTRRYLQTGSSRLQPLEENGRARPTKPAGAYDVAWPIQSAGAAWGANYVTRAKMTISEAQNATAEMLVADKRWVRDHILAALFLDGTWTFEDPLYGNLTIQDIASGDAVTYPLMTGADTSATDEHHLAQAAGIADATNPYPTIFTELMEHPDNGGQVVALIPTGLRATTEALATFFGQSDPNIRQGSGAAELVGTLNMSLPGTLIGYESSGVWVVEWAGMPANYILAVTTEGRRPLAMREDQETELQGFNRVAERNDHPFYESQWLRRCGFGALNRVGAVAYRVGNGTYAVPTGYTSPMA